MIQRNIPVLILSALLFDVGCLEATQPKDPAHRCEAWENDVSPFPWEPSYLDECDAKQLNWSAETQTASCPFTADFLGETCPEGEWECVENFTQAGHPGVRCRIPAIPLPRECADTPESVREEIRKTKFGWYYCENSGEYFSDAGASGDFPNLCIAEKQLTDSARRAVETAIRAGVQCLSRWVDQPDCCLPLL